MEAWIKEVTSKLNRKIVDILFGEHAAKDKNLTVEDTDFVEKAVRFGKVDETKSTLIVEDEVGRTRTLLKNMITFKLIRTEQEIVGSSIVKRSEERIKGR